MESVALPGAGERGRAVLCRVGERRCALPIEQVVETLRPLPIDEVRGAPSFVLGVTLLRGAPVPVVDAARLLGVVASGAPTRFVAVRVGERRVVLAVDEVLGIGEVPAALRAELPPLVASIDAAAIAALASADGELLHVLEAARLVPDGAWSAIAPGSGG